MISLYTIKQFPRLLILTILLCSPLQAAGGKLTGRVTEAQTGEPVMYANITVTHVIQQGREVSLQMPMGAMSDKDGYYVILNVPAGEYTLRASMVGYRSVILKEVRVDPDRTIEQNFILEEATIDIGEVIVTAQKEVIKADVYGTQEYISSDQIQSLPVIRVDEYIGKLKGVTLTSNSDGYGLRIRGGDIRETDIRLDGISLQDPRSGNSYLGFNSTSVDEVQLITGGFEAKYGGVRSGLLNVKTVDASRDRFTVNFKTTYTPEGQYRFFGTNPYSSDSWIYKIYADTSENGYAWRGVDPNDPKIPVDFREFKGWGKTTLPIEMRALDSLQRYELWQMQHPHYGIARRPDYIFEGTITGPMPLPNTVFMTAFKYENSQFVYPLGPRDDYLDWNGQLKLTTALEKMKFSVNGMYAKIFSNTSAQSISYDLSQRFAYLNTNTPGSVERQAAMLAGQGILSMYNKSMLQEFEQTYAMGGARFTHIPDPKLFYTIDFQVGYNGQDLTPMLMDMSRDTLDNYIYMYSEAAKKWYQFYSPSAGLPNGSTNLTMDGISKFRMYGGHAWADSSYSYNYQLKGDLTWQFNRFNEVTTGFSASLQRINVYAGFWNQSAIAFTPNSWQYYKGAPLELGLYIQDKMEYEGMILNAGLRIDYFDANKDRYTVAFPSDKDYASLYTSVYSNLEGPYNSYEKWLLFRGLLDEPPGWPTEENPAQVKLAPRLGVSFPITENSKMYFNFGHFYQRPSASILYNIKLNSGSTIVPTPELPMARTKSYEFGYEQVFLTDFLFNVTAYYKDVSNEPLLRTYKDWYQTNNVSKYFPDEYRDVRGVEFRLERNYGRFVTFKAMYDYMLESRGVTGFAEVYEKLVEFRNHLLRNPSKPRTIPRPRANVTLDLRTPDDYGSLLGNWLANIFFEWRDGGEVLLNQDVTVFALQKWIERVNYWNIDFRLSKLVNLMGSGIEVSLIVKNLTNNKWLTTAHMTLAEESEYKSQIEANGGKWGEYKPEHLAKVFESSWENVLFLNPRRIILGLRINL